MRYTRGKNVTLLAKDKKRNKATRRKFQTKKENRRLIEQYVV